MSPSIEPLIRATRSLARQAASLRFAEPVAWVYNPLEYASDVHLAYLRRFGSAPKRVLFLGMNPGPFGMAQTGIPFGEVSVVRDWLKLEGPIRRPRAEHPKRPVDGFNCRRSEVSGRRLWGLFAARFGTPEAFFVDHFVANYCPLAFMDSGGKNLTPDRLASAEADKLQAICDRHLRSLVHCLQPEWVIGVGDFALGRARAALGGTGGLRLGRILHPSPASPAANRDWAGQATRQLRELGVWS